MSRTPRPRRVVVPLELLPPKAAERAAEYHRLRDSAVEALIAAENLRNQRDHTAASDRAALAAAASAGKPLPTEQLPELEADITEAERLLAGLCEATEAAWHACHDGLTQALPEIKQAATETTTRHRERIGKLAKQLTEEIERHDSTVATVSFFEHVTSSPAKRTVVTGPGTGEGTSGTAQQPGTPSRRLIDLARDLSAWATGHP